MIEGSRGVWDVYHVPIILGGVSLLFVLLSITILIKTYQPTSPIRFEQENNEGSRSGDNARDMLVDIEGGVVRPGVYRLPEGSRIEELIEKSQGFSRDADLAKVAQTINRAAKLSDGAKVYIPRLSEPVVDLGIPSGQNQSVGINSGSPQEFDALPGVGMVTAQKIIDNRPYTRIEELVEKKVMSQSLLEKLRDSLHL